MRFNVLVGEVMRKNVKKLETEAPIEHAAQIMRDEQIGSVVVTDNHAVKGIVTTSDIVYKYVASRHGQRVGDIMTTQLVTIQPEKTIEEAAHLMVRHHIEKILVFDAGRLVGILTNNDILRIEPALFETLLERLKMKGIDHESLTCESCGTTDLTVEDRNGRPLCSQCAE